MTKLVTPDEKNTQLFKIVSLLTGARGAHAARSPPWPTLARSVSRLEELAQGRRLLPRLGAARRRCLVTLSFHSLCPTRKPLARFHTPPSVSTALLSGGGYPVALGVMLALVGAALVVALAGLDGQLGTAAKKNASLRDVFDTRNPNLNW